MISRARYEPKGSTFLRSDHMDYSPATLVTERGLDWHAAREAYPKDTNVFANEPRNRNLQRATYNAFGDRLKTDFKSTSHDHMEQIKLKDDYVTRITSPKMIDSSTFDEVGKQRTIDGPSSGFGSVLPRFSEEHGKRYLDTTYACSYKSDLPLSTTSTDVDSNDADKIKTTINKKCRSQFTDTSDYHREGLNTWQDESGVYGNSELKQSMLAKTNTIPERIR